MFLCPRPTTKDFNGGFFADVCCGVYDPSGQRSLGEILPFLLPCLFSAIRQNPVEPGYFLIDLGGNLLAS